MWKAVLLHGICEPAWERELHSKLMFSPRQITSHLRRSSFARKIWLKWNACNGGDGSAVIASVGLQLAGAHAIPTVGRFPLHSPLLRKSWLVSCPPPSDMLKFGGWSRLSRGLNRASTLVTSRSALQRQAATTPTHRSTGKEVGRSDSLARLVGDERHLRSKNRWSDLQFTLSPSQLAAFFIDARAKRFTVRSDWVSLTLLIQLSCNEDWLPFTQVRSMMIFPQVHLRKPCYDFYFL